MIAKSVSVLFTLHFFKRKAQKISTGSKRLPISCKKAWKFQSVNGVDIFVPIWTGWVYIDYSLPNWTRTVSPPPTKHVFDFSPLIPVQISLRSNWPPNQSQFCSRYIFLKGKHKNRVLKKRAPAQNDRFFSSHFPKSLKILNTHHGLFSCGGGRGVSRIHFDFSKSLASKL